MSRANIPLVAFNRGLVSPKAIARVDLDRTKLSAEVMTNWLPKTQGAMRIRPGTKYKGSSYSDTGAAWIEFVAATDDVALVELTNQKMRIWIDDALLGRPLVDTTVTLADTGWSNTSTGGALSTSATDIIPEMTAATTNGVTITASSQDIVSGAQNRSAWKAADDDITNSFWADTGAGNNALPSWWNVDFGAANTKAVTSYSVRARDDAGALDNAPRHWRLITGNFDTGTYAIDTGKWTLEDERAAEIDWAVSEKRSYTLPGADTGTVEARRHWRLFVTQVDTGAGTPSYQLNIAEIEMFDAATAQQVKKQSGTVTLNATSIGALARYQKRVVVSDTGTEHSLYIDVGRGPVTLRVGSTSGDDDYISESILGTGHHNLAFTPQAPFHITLQTDDIVDRVVQSLTIGDSGTVEITTPIPATSLDDVRYDQSADVVFVDAYGIPPGKIERRGTGRSWSFVYLQPNDGPFLPAASSSAKLSITAKYGNAQALSDVPFFSADHATNGGALLRMFHSGQSGVWPLGALNAATDAIEVTGIKDTGTAGSNSERTISISVSGTYVGTLQIERSFEGPDYGFHPASKDILDTGFTPAFNKNETDTGTFVRTIYDKDNNLSVWYRVKLIAWTSGVALVTMSYKNGGVNGIARITGYNTNQNVNVEILSRFSDTGSTDSWQEGAWSSAQRYPSAVALHESRLCHAGGATLWASVSDNYESHDDETVGDAGPLYRTLGSGPVDKVFYLVSLLRLVMGMAGAEIAVRSSSLDEPLTPSNNSAKAFSTQGSANLRAVKLDNQAIFVQRSGVRMFAINAAQAFGEYESQELTLLIPDLLNPGVVSIAVQRQPDTRIHCVLADGTVAICTFEPQEEVLCWSLWQTDGTVEKAMVLPGTSEDAVYYHVNRTIGGATKRYLERWASETESEGDTGLSWIADCAASYTDTGRATALTGFSHLNGEQVVVWASDTGAAVTNPETPDAGLDLSPDVAGVQTLYTVTGGTVTVTRPVHHAVAGLPFTADWKSTKMAFAAEKGTALTQMKRVGEIGFVLYNAHNNGLYFGRDTGALDALPRVSDNGATVDPDRIFKTFDQVAVSFPGTLDSDSRVHLRAKAPRPMTVLAAVPSVETDEKDAPDKR